MQSQEHYSVDTISREIENHNKDFSGPPRNGSKNGSAGSNSSPNQNQIIEKKMSEKINHHVGLKILYEMSWLDRYSDIVDIEGIKSQLKANISHNHSNQGQQQADSQLLSSQ